jgi:hypothetical protein
VSSVKQLMDMAEDVYRSEIYLRGRWIKVPAVKVGANTLFVRGDWLKLAVVKSEEWLPSEVEDPNLCIKVLKAEKSNVGRVDIFSFAQKPPAVEPKYDFPMELDSVAAIRLNTFQEWWEGLPQATRKNVRRAEKRGVVVSVRAFDDELLQGIYEINQDSPFRQGERNVQYGKGIDELRKDYGSFLDRSELICAHVGEEMVGFMKVVFRGNTASILNFLPKLSHEDKRPANAMLAKAVESCAARGVTCITYGYFNYGNKRESSLREFKVRNGFEEMLVPRFYVPLTPWGKLAIACRLHRGLLGILPSRVINLALDFRAKCYTLKNKMPV